MLLSVSVTAETNLEVDYCFFLFLLLFLFFNFLAVFLVCRFVVVAVVVVVCFVDICFFFFHFIVSSCFPMSVNVVCRLFGDMILFSSSFYRFLLCFPEIFCASSLKLA